MNQRQFTEQDTNGATLVKAQFNSISPENILKWESVHPQPDRYDFAGADRYVEFGEKNHMYLIGHTLVWHSQTPAWVFNDARGNPMTATPANQALLTQRMQNHIQQVMTHFGNDVPIWDVVNEAIDPSQPDGYRRSPWFNVLGPQYIDIAFQAARAANPTAKLYINDFDTTNPSKRDALLAVVRDLRSRGIPIDGVGLQMHISQLDFDEAAVTNNIARLTALGLQVHITELDVALPTSSTGQAQDDDLQKQADIYRRVVRACRQSPGCTAIQTWGFTDKYSWIGSHSQGTQGAALLFNRAYKPKPAYNAMLQELSDPRNR
jgi:endo-1,4-beta-xylanase